MKYIRLSQNSGLKVSIISLGTWYLPRTEVRDEYGIPQIDIEATKKLLKKAVDSGINFIDTANRYHGAVSPIPVTHVGYVEKLLGKLLKELGIDRESLVIATKVGGDMASWPNGSGLSRKHIMWQIRESLNRLQMEYVDIYYAHRFDPDTPKREVMSTFNDLVRMGLVRYIGMSNIPPSDLVEYQMIADSYNYEPITVLQYRYNWLDRSIESDIIPIAKKFGMGITVYSPLAQGILTGKYVDTQLKKWVIPSGSRGEISDSVKKMFTDENLRKVLEFVEFAKSKGVTPTQLAIAWILKKSEQFDVPIIPIIGATKTTHIDEVLEALNITLTPDDMKILDEIK
ncbi:MAG: aldo/keto reductase [Ignisphaera sp.]